MFSRFGQRYDPLMEAFRRALQHSRTLEDIERKLPGNVTPSKLAAAQEALTVARNAIRTRDLERKKTREANKLLRAQGIDPSKKPAQMTVEQFDTARKTLRAAIQPQFPAYKAELFRILREQVDQILKRLAAANGDAYAAAYGEDYETLSNRAWRAQDPRERELAKSKLENGNAVLAETRKWTVEAALPEGKFRDRGRAGSVDPRVPASNGYINTALDVEAQRMTERDFDSYTQKLAGKIGLPIARAHVQGHLWTRSVLTAVLVEDFWNDTEKAPQQEWSTKMILNRSALGTLFNQWPTRQIL